jgi:rhamnulokinase
VPGAQVLAIDLGAESGRVWSVRLADGRLKTRELHRFANRPVRVRGTLHWNVLQLWAEVQHGIGKSLQQPGLRPPDSLGVDSWAVDFALLDDHGNLLGNPVHYRDARTSGMMQRVFELLDRDTIFAETGVQFLPINTLYQLASLKLNADPQLEAASTFLLLPDLLHYWLGGAVACEFTNATTTQLFDPVRLRWSEQVLGALDLPAALFPEVVPPGSRLGSYRDIPVTAPATHDTASAVAGLPATGADHAFISSGTWSLVGTEVDAPVLSAAALAANLTNEGGHGNFRLLKNVTGLWIVQQCRETWQQAGQHHDYAELTALAVAATPLRSLIPADHPDFLQPGDHPALITRLCRESGEPVPETAGQMIRCILESLALAYALVINQLLCQLSADAAGLPVLAGPAEATVLGNATVQLIALGAFRDLKEARAAIARSTAVTRFEPRDQARWQHARDRYQQLQRSHA